jgi:hypothetical protein
MLLGPLFGICPALTGNRGTGGLVRGDDWGKAVEELGAEFA